MFKGVTGWLVEGQTHTLILSETIQIIIKNNNKMTTDILTTYTRREGHITHKLSNYRARTPVGITR